MVTRPRYLQFSSLDHYAPGRHYELGRQSQYSGNAETAWLIDYVAGAFAAFERGSARAEPHFSNAVFNSVLSHAYSIHAIVLDVYGRQCEQQYGGDGNQK